MTTKLPEWASEHDQIFKMGLSCGHQEESLPSAAEFDDNWLRFKGYLGNVGLGICMLIDAQAQAKFERVEQKYISGRKARTPQS